MAHIMYIHNATLGPNGTTVDVVGQKSQGEEPNVLGDILQKYYSLFLMCVGTVGNGLSLAVLSRKTFRSSPIGIYLRWLAVSDLTALYTGSVYFWAKANFDYDIRDTNALACRFHRWISYTAVDLSAWILILMTVARLISILYPLRTFWTRCVTYVSLFVTMAAALLANLPMFIFYGRMKTYSNGVTKCKYFPEYRFFIKEVWNWIVLVKFGLLPVAILIVLNTILCIRVFRSSKEMKRMNNNSYKMHKAPEENVSTSGRFGYMIHRLSGRRLMKNHAINSARNLNYVSNTDITRLTTTGDMAASLLQSSEDINRRSVLNSRYASTEELRKELSETYGIVRDNPVVNSPNGASNSTRDNLDKTRGNVFIRFAKYVVDIKIRNRKSKYFISTSSSSKDKIESRKLKETRPLSTASDGAVVMRSKSSSRSLCYDSRNSFHFVRDSLQYTKEKRGITTSRQESEELVPGKFGDSEESSHLLSQNQTRENDIKRPTPIFTISAAGSDGPPKSVILSDGETVGESINVPTASSIDQEYPEDSYMFEDSDCSDSEENPNLSVSKTETRESKSSLKKKINKDSNSLNTSFEISTPDVTDNLRAASRKLQHLSLHPDSYSECSSTIPLRKLNNNHKRLASTESLNHNGDVSANEDSSAPESETSHRSSGGGLLGTQSDPSKLLGDGGGEGGSPGRLSPCIVSNGLLTPRGDNQVSGSRQSLNVAIQRGRTGGGKAKTRNLTATLLVVNIVFIICNIPIVVYMTSRKYLFQDRRPNSPGTTFELIANFIMYTNNASNFIMYCLSGTRFRQELKAMLREALDLICGRRRKRRRFNNTRRW